MLMSDTAFYATHLLKIRSVLKNILFYLIFFTIEISYVYLNLQVTELEVCTLVMFSVVFIKTKKNYLGNFRKGIRLVFDHFFYLIRFKVEGKHETYAG